MSNLLLENFINEINAKREDAINKVFSDRMISIEKQINEIPEIVKFYNERCSFRDGFEKSVANPNGFTTQDLAYKSHWRSFVSLCDSFNFVNIIFSVKDLSPKDYRPRDYRTYQYELRDMEVIKKESMKSMVCLICTYQEFVTQSQRLIIVLKSQIVKSNHLNKKVILFLN